jgi:hypothetical protein
MQTAAAVSLAFGCGFHKIRSEDSSTPVILDLRCDGPVYVDHHQTDVEEGERINAFWAVVVLHNVMTAALEPKSHVCGTLEAPGLIDVPWPLEVDDYLHVSLFLNLTRPG